MPEQRQKVRARFWVETVLAGVSAGIFVLTLVSHDWLEAFGFDPDGGNGAVEWVVVGVLITCSLALALAARVEWRRVVTDSG